MAALFTDVNIAAAAASSGVFFLYRAGRLIYIGLAAQGVTIREELARHHAGESGPCIQAATEFDYEAADDALRLYRHHLASYVAQTGGDLPECNERRRLYPAIAWRR